MGRHSCSCLCKCFIITITQPSSRRHRLWLRVCARVPVAVTEPVRPSKPHVLLPGPLQSEVCWSWLESFGGNVQSLEGFPGAEPLKGNRSHTLQQNGLRPPGARRRPRTSSKLQKTEILTLSLLVRRRKALTDGELTDCNRGRISGGPGIQAQAPLGVMSMTSHSGGSGLSAQ